MMGLFLNMDASKDSKRKIQIGIAGDISDSYLGLGIYALQYLDSSRFAIDFHNISEEEARNRMAAGELSAYVCIPDGFIDSLISGENKPITYVTSNGQMGVGSLIINELIDVVSNFITESQNGIYGMQRFMLQHALEADFEAATNELNLRYIEFILNRTSVYGFETIGISNDLSLTGYYLCGILILFFLLWGINCSTLFSKKDIALSRLLASKGQGAFLQVLGEYLAYLLLMLFSLLCITVILILAVNIVGFPVPEWENAGSAKILLFVLAQIPVIAVISAFQFFLYELIDNIVSAVILQFLCAICLGYLSGCFYPVNFFPDSMQKLAVMLPTGAALSYADKSLLAKPAIGEAVLLILYFTVFITLSVMTRRQRLKGAFKNEKKKNFPVVSPAE